MFLYDIGIFLYGLALRAVSPFNVKARLWLRGRRKIFSRLGQAIGPGDRVAWVHCASLGEFEQGRPVIEAIRAEHPQMKILLTFFSPSGYEVRKNYDGADLVFYLPLDTPRNARRFVAAVHPELAVFVKYEFWLNLLRRLEKAGCRTYVISAIFRRDSVFFRWYGGMFRRALARFSRIFVQNEESRGLLSELGIDRVTVSGDTRFDRVARIASQARVLPVVERFAAGARVFIAGSTWPPDEQIIMQAIGAFPGLKFIIAPHETDQARIDRFIAESPRKAVRYTAGEEGVESADVLIIDTIGILSSVYRYGAFGYIGGGFGVGIHNTLEAATFGLPLAFGPNYRKFREACELVGLGAATSVTSYAELEKWLEELLRDNELYLEKRHAAADYVIRNCGATQLIVDTIFG